MKTCFAPLLALTLVCMQCNENAAPPATPGKGYSVTVDGKTVEVLPLSTYAERRAPNYTIAKGAGLLIAHARERHIHLYGASQTLQAGFIDSQGKIVDVQPFNPGEQGVTSEREAKYALLCDLELKKGQVVSFSEALQKISPEENPVMRINGVPIYVEISNHADLRSRGLMWRPRMSEDDGMLFAYPSAGERSFWMGKCFLKLSLAYIRSDLAVSEFHDMDPYRDPFQEHDYKSWPSKEEVQYVLEVNQGFFRKHGLKEGMKVELPHELRQYPPR